MTRIAIDPVTRIGGHLRIEADVADGVVADAWSSGTMFRGIEQILRGRDPRDAWLFAQRVCGSCTGVQALASVRAVENALGVTVPRNARLVRNVIAGTQYLLDHVVHFYHLHAFDWVDVESALRANPAATSALAVATSAWPQSTVSGFRDARDRLRQFLSSGQLGPFANGPWGHPAYRLSAEANLLVVAHYLEALDWQRATARIHTILGGKNPHPQTFLVGGMALAPPWGGPSRGIPGEHPQQVDKRAPATLSKASLDEIADLIAAARSFVDQVYVPDVLLVAGHYPEWAALGAGIGNYMSFGEFPESGTAGRALLLPPGRVMGRVMARVQEVDQADVTETVAHSWYTHDGDVEGPLNPGEGQTNPKYAGPPLPYTTLAGAEKYSWIKAPRYQDEPMEVGPLARVLVAYVEGRGDVRAAVHRVISALGVGPDALFGTLGRMVARAVEAEVVAARLGGWHRELTQSLADGDLAFADMSRWDPAAWPQEARGWSLGEAPGGALGHWVTIRDRTIQSYQIVDASTWNGSPRDGRGRRGAWEEALVGTPVADPERPLEILRTLHSFDPCTACGVHAFDPADAGPLEIRVSRARSR
ncbi:MAG: nickel-dependent hydrogenase large subunit [Chloroflexota bacterium]